MKFRDDPKTKTGRKKPIIHWVSGHLKGANKSKIEKYKRGIQKFECDGYMIEITEPKKRSHEFGRIK